MPISLDKSHLVFDTYDLVSQECVSHHYYRDADGTIRSSVGHFRYLWPSECDLMAQLADLELESRTTDWHSNPFLPTTGRHVSVWRRPPGG